MEQVQSFELSQFKGEPNKGRLSFHHMPSHFFFQQCHRLKKLKWDVIWCDLREEYKCAIERQKELEELIILADGIGKLVHFWINAKGSDTKNFCVLQAAKMINSITVKVTYQCVIRSAFAATQGILHGTIIFRK